MMGALENLPAFLNGPSFVAIFALIIVLLVTSSNVSQPGQKKTYFPRCFSPSTERFLPVAETLVWYWPVLWRAENGSNYYYYHYYHHPHHPPHPHYYHHPHHPPHPRVCVCVFVFLKEHKRKAVYVFNPLLLILNVTPMSGEPALSFSVPHSVRVCVVFRFLGVCSCGLPCFSNSAALSHRWA